MGLFGKLFAGPSPVEGRIAVRDRPEGVHYFFTTWFFPSSAGGAPPDGVEDPRRVEAEVKRSSSFHSDQGYMISAELGAGHWQVVVRSQPYVLEGDRVLTDPGKARLHRPHAKAFEVVAGQPKHLAIRLEMEAAPAARPIRFRPPIHERAGDALWRRYREAVALSGTSPAAALTAFETLADAPERIDPQTREEIRFLAEVGRAVCLHQSGNPDAAASVLTQLGTPEAISSGGFDAYTQSTFFGVSAIVLGLGDESGTALRTHACAAVVAFRESFAKGGRERDDAETLAIGTWTKCIARLLARKAWVALRELGDDGKKIADTHRLAGIKFYSCCAKIEAQLALGDAGGAAAETEELRGLMTGSAGTPAGIATLLGRARDAGLLRAAAQLEGS